MGLHALRISHSNSVFLGLVLPFASRRASGIGVSLPERLALLSVCTALIFMSISLNVVGIEP